MNRTILLIENTDLQAFKKACIELDIRIINEENYSNSSKRIDIEYTTIITLFYLGLLTQHLNQSKFSLQ